MEPEILRAERATIETYLTSESRLRDYTHELRDLRRAAYTLSDAEEKLLADPVRRLASPGAIFNILSNADFAYPVVTLADGQSAKVNHARYTELRASRQSCRPSRRAVCALHVARRVPSHLRHDDGRAGAEGIVLLCAHESMAPRSRPRWTPTTS